MNIYAHAKNAFDERAVELGELFAIPAAISVHNARVLAETRRLTIQVQRAVASRAVIDRTVGIFMNRNGGSADEALARLEAMSRAQHGKLADVAQRVLDDSTHSPDCRAPTSDG